MSRGRGRKVLRAAGWVLLVLAALSVVTWRQARGVALEREIHALEGERALAEAERVELQRRIQRLQSRSRVVRDAARLMLHVPGDHEVVILPLAGEAR